MAAQGDGAYAPFAVGQLVMVQRPDMTLRGGEVVDPAGLRAADKAKLEAKQRGVRAGRPSRRNPTCQPCAALRGAARAMRPALHRRAAHPARARGRGA